MNALDYAKRYKVLVGIFGVLVADDNKRRIGKWWVAASNAEKQ